ncbi:MAG TPA: sigma-70 family RNA polymerase sigma factor [Abditibacterium sp.]|jgi:RNA polymerase sigma-70 factor (ECF subfamily)
MTREEFDELFREYWGIVYLFCRRRSQNEDLAADTAQEIFCRKWAAIHTYDPQRGHFKTWLLRNAFNECVSVARERNRKPETPLDSDFIVPAQPDETRQNDWRLVLTQALRALPPDEADVLDFRFNHGFTLVETAALMHLTFSEVRTLQKNGLRRLRDWLVAAGIEGVEWDGN